MISDDEGLTGAPFAVAAANQHRIYSVPGLEAQTRRVRSEQTERRRRMEAERDADAIWERMPSEGECGTCLSAEIPCYREVLENNGRGEKGSKANGVAVKVGSATYGRCQRCLIIRRVCETSNTAAGRRVQMEKSSAKGSAKKRKRDAEGVEDGPGTRGQKKKTRQEAIEGTTPKCDSNRAQGLGASLAKKLSEGQERVAKGLEAFFAEQLKMIEVIQHKEAL